MKNIIVSGANKGIGRAICLRLLRDFTDTHVFLGSRNLERGHDAVNGIISEIGPQSASRIEVIHLDVTNIESVLDAAAQIRRKFPTEASPLYGLINNAGIGFTDDAMSVIKTNIIAVKHVCDAFLPLLDPSNGRIVNISSGSAPMFVEKLTPLEQEFFTNSNATWKMIEDKIDSFYGDGTGLDNGTVYGFSKALLNLYTISLAHAHPELCITSCSPGFIKTDMTRHFGATNPPEVGTVAPIFCLLGDAHSGYYYGSDALRSPLHKYRAPGDPPYDP